MNTNRVKSALYGVALLAALTSVPLFAAPGGGGPPPKPPCGTSGPLNVTDPTPDYTYEFGSNSGNQVVKFTVSSPGLNITGACDSNLPYVFGNGQGDDPYIAPYTVQVGAITYGSDPDGAGPLNAGEPVLTGIDNAIKAALSQFLTPPFVLANPGNGSQEISFTFTDAGNSIPVGEYDIGIDVAAKTGNNCGDSGNESCNGGLGAPDPVAFALEVKAPTVVDTLPPTVTINSPTSEQQFGLSDTVSVQFTSLDPWENGAGTGITATRAKVTACSGLSVFNLADLTNDPPLPQDANINVTTTTSVGTDDLGIGAFVLTAEADDGASHTGYAYQAFSVGANIAPLPPIAVPNRKFNTGSTVPVKWTITDANGQFVEPFASIRITITDPDNIKVADRVAGSGATNIRWELDDYGNAVQYITNFPIPSKVGVYTVHVFLTNVCGDSVEQGSFTFIAANKGGKV